MTLTTGQPTLGDVAREGVIYRFDIDASSTKAYRVCAGGIGAEGAWQSLSGVPHALVVATPTVARLHSGGVIDRIARHGCKVDLIVLPVTEREKTMDSVLEVCAAAGRHDIPRDGVLIGLGGGVCTDIVSLAANLYRRGIGHIRVPTTLLGQVDAAIGIKGGVNFRGKNDIGCFHPPREVIIDPEFLRTLPPAEARSGLAEIVKVAIMRDVELFALTETHWHELVAPLPAVLPATARAIIGEAIARLLEELEPNLYEDQGFERLADFGHSFSPAIEAASGFSIRHGEAVAIDMALSTEIARGRGMIAEDDADRIVAILTQIGLPVRHDRLNPQFCRGALEKMAAHRGGSAKLVVPTSIGSGAFIRESGELSDFEIANAIARLDASAAMALPKLSIAV